MKHLTMACLSALCLATACLSPGKRPGSQASAHQNHLFIEQMQQSGALTEMDGVVLEGVIAINVFTGDQAAIAVEVKTPELEPGGRTFYLQIAPDAVFPDAVSGQAGSVLFTPTHLWVALPALNHSLRLSLTGEPLPEAMATLTAQATYEGYGLGYLSAIDLDFPPQAFCGCMRNGTTPDPGDYGMSSDAVVCENGGEGATSCANQTVNNGPGSVACGEGWYACCNRL